MVVAVVEMRNQLVGWHQGAYKQGDLAPREIKVVPLIGIICIAIWGIGWRFALTNKIGLLCYHIPQ